MNGLHERLEAFPGQPLLASDLLDILGRRHTRVLLDHLVALPEPGGPEGIALRETQENVLIGLGGRMSEQRILG